MSNMAKKARDVYERFASDYPKPVGEFSTITVATWDEQGTVSQALTTFIYAEAVAARDAEWRSAVGRVRAEYCGPRTSVLSGPIHSALDALLAAMEGK